MIVLDKLELRLGRQSDGDIVMGVRLVGEPGAAKLALAWCLAEVGLKVAGNLSHTQHVHKLGAELFFAGLPST